MARMVSLPTHGEVLGERHVMWSDDFQKTPETDTLVNLMKLQSKQGFQCTLEDVILNFIFLGYNSMTSFFERAFKVENMIYEFLLKYDIDIAHHYSIYKKIIEKEIPHVFDSVLELTILKKIKELEFELGISLSLQHDKNNFSKFNRVRMGTIWKPCPKDTMDKTQEVCNLDEFIISDFSKNEKEAESPFSLKNLYEMIQILNSKITTSESGPGLYVIQANKVKFHDVASYCSGTLSHDIPGLPPRSEWSGIPIFINDDEEKENGKFQYIVTDLKSLQSSKKSRKCFSEIFLPGYPITVVNLDIDKPLEPGISISDSDIEMSVTTLLDLIYLAVLEWIPVETRRKFKDLGTENLGTVHVFIRLNAYPKKFSARYVWMPPFELCFKDIDELKVFMKILKKESVKNENFFTSWSKTNPPFLETAIDSAPYAKHKSCRLPNANKKTQSGEIGRFDHYKSFNNMFPIKKETLNSITFGISRQRLSLDRPSLGIEFLQWATQRLFTYKNSTILNDYGLSTGPCKETLDKYITYLSKIWNGIKIIPLEKSVRLEPENYRIPKPVCLIHNRSHNSATFSIVVTEHGAYPRCFNPNGIFLKENEYLTFSLTENGHTIGKKVKQTQ